MNDAPNVSEKATPLVVQLVQVITTEFNDTLEPENFSTGAKEKQNELYGLFVGAYNS